MKNIIINIIKVSIIILFIIGIKSYNLYRYTPAEINIETNENIFVSYNSIKANRKIEKMNFYLDNLYTSNDIDNTYIKDKKELKINIKHNILRNICNESNIFPTEYIDLLKKNNINNEVELIKYAYTSNNSNIFTSINKMKIKYFSNLLINKLEIDGNIQVVDGLDAIINKKNNTEVFIFNNGNLYKMTFNSSYTETEIKNILNSIYFD